jgi:prepilin-type N-terminal cleavage/methylation domain-containing protein
MKRKGNRGFTLIELLVVIAIIGILSSVVLASLNTARQKSRDAKRVSDIKQLQIALEFYFDANGGYPSVLSTATVVTPGYIGVLPTPPAGASETAYNYEPTGTGCTGYRLGVTLEDNGHTVLSSDADSAEAVSLGLVCPDATVGAETTLDGVSAACGTTGTGTDACFDVTP